MRTFVGTSGYNYDEWQGRFYPDKLAKAKRLPYYASRFEAVEINYTYYRFPSEKALAGWAAETPPGFRFALKAWQGITHQRRLKEAAEPARDFLQRVATLGDKLGPVLFGLPPNLPRDLPRLQAFLAALPREAACAFEFRHPSWLDDTVYAALVEAGVALCVADSEDLETPFLRTAPFGYLRLRRARLRRAGARRLGGAHPLRRLQRRRPRLLQARGRGAGRGLRRRPGAAAGGLRG